MGTGSTGDIGNVGAIIFPDVVLVGGSPCSYLTIVGNVGCHEHTAHTAIFGQSVFFQSLCLLFHQFCRLWCGAEWGGGIQREEAVEVVCLIL